MRREEEAERLGSLPLGDRRMDRALPRTGVALLLSAAAGAVLASILRVPGWM
jgi:hypothetical protein